MRPSPLSRRRWDVVVSAGSWEVRTRPTCWLLPGDLFVFRSLRLSAPTWIRATKVMNTNDFLVGYKGYMAGDAAVVHLTEIAQVKKSQLTRSSELWHRGASDRDQFMLRQRLSYFIKTRKIELTLCQPPIIPVPLHGRQVTSRVPWHCQHSFPLTSPVRSHRLTLASRWMT